DEERFVRQVLQDTFEFTWRFNGSPLNRGCSAGLPDRERTRRVATDGGQQADDIAARHPEQLPERSQLLVFGQEVCSPGQENVGPDAIGCQRHPCRNRKCSAQPDPTRFVSEARPALVDIDRTDRPLLKIYRQTGHRLPPWLLEAQANPRPLPSRSDRGRPEYRQL